MTSQIQRTVARKRDVMRNHDNETLHKRDVMRNHDNERLHNNMNVQYMRPGYLQWGPILELWCGKRVRGNERNK